MRVVKCNEVEDIISTANTFLVLDLCKNYLDSAIALKSTCYFLIV